MWWNSVKLIVDNIMISFTEYARSRGEYDLDEIFGLFGKKKSRFAEDPQYGAAFEVLLKKNGGDQDAAEKELIQIASTPMGKLQLMRMGMGQSHGTDAGLDQQTYGANSLGGAQVFGQRPGSQR